MKKRIFLLPLLACALSGCEFLGITIEKINKEETGGTQQNQNGGNEQGQNTPTKRDGLSIATAYTAEEAVALMDKAGTGVVVDKKEYYVAGKFDVGTTVNASYHQWYGTCAAGAKTFKVSGATNDSGATYEEVDGKLDGVDFVVKGYMELYNGEYKIGYLPASASPTGSKYVPSLVKLGTTSAGGSTTGGGSTGGGSTTGGGTSGTMTGLTSVVKVDLSSTTAKSGSGENGRLTDSELKTLITGNTNVSGKVTNATGTNVYQGYVPSTGDTSAWKDGVNGCVRMGGSSKTGTLILTVSESVKGIRLNAHAWAVKESFTDEISVNGAAAVKMTLDYANYEFTFSGATTVTITSTNRVFIKSIELFK